MTTQTWIRMQDGSQYPLTLATNSDTPHFISYLRDQDHATADISKDAIDIAVSVKGDDNLPDTVLTGIQEKLDAAYYRAVAIKEAEIKDVPDWVLRGIFP